MKNLQSLTKSILSILLIFGLFSACKKSSDSEISLQGSPKIAFGIKMDSKTMSLSAVNSKQTAHISEVSMVTWTSGIANISKFKFEAKKGSTEREFETSLLTNVDLFSLNPALTSVAVDTGTYREIEFKAVFTKATSSAIPLALKGVFKAQSGKEVPIEIQVNEDLTIKVEAEDIHVENSQDLQAILNLHLNQLLAGIGASELEAAPQTGQTIVINSTSNIDLYNKIKANFLRSFGSEVEKHRRGDNKG